MRNIIVKNAFIGTLLALSSQLSTSFQAQNNSVPVNGYSDIILFDKPVAYFRFEETSGAVATNSVPAGVDGAYYTGDEANPGDGGTPSSAKGDAGPKPPDFLGFDANNRSATFGGSATQDWVDAKKQYLQHLGAFSLEYWVRPTIRVSDPTTFGTRIGIVGQNDAVEYGFIDANTIQIWTPNGGSLNTPYSFPDNEWHHVATIADGSTLKNYYDGQLVGTSGSGTGDYGSSTYFVHIGGAGVFDVTGNYFTGNIDEVAIFDRAISASRIAEHYKAAKNGGSFTVPFINDPSGNLYGFTIGVTDVGQHVADTNTIVLKYDGTTVTPTSVTKTNGVTTVAYNTPTALVSASTHTTSMAIKDTTGASYSADGTFVAPTYATILPSFAVTGVDTTKPGFKVKPYQVTAAQPNTMAWTEEMFAGLHGPNIADLTQTIDGTPIDANGYYTVTNVVNWDKDGSADGNFQDNTGYTDSTLPGQPAGDGSGTYNNDGEEVLTYVQFPTGGVFYTMGVNSDDGFKVSTGLNPKDAFSSVILGTFDVAGGRGAADTIFRFYVPTAGIYPVRLLWENGGSGANCEWFTVQPDGTKILLNDPSSTNTTGIKAFYSGPATATSAYVLSFTHALVSGKVLLADAATQVTAGSAKLYMNGAAVPTTGGKSNAVTTLNYLLNAPFAPGSTVAVSVVYQDNTSATITNSTTFVAGTYSAITKDSVAARAGFIRGTGGFTADTGGHTGKAGDYAIDTTLGGGTWVDIEDVSFLNAAATNDTLSMTMWVKKYDIVNGSAFWAQLSQVATGTDLRGFQAHTPWSDDTIYFDTAGCCDGAVQRISANINTFDAYNAVGNDTYWTNWHHFVFTKKADQKNIYIDGKLFLNGSSTDPLQPYFVGLGLLTDGLPGADYMHGLIDDFAVFSTEISAADAAKLASGTSPSALTGETLVAYWNFDDAVPVSGIKITSITAAAGNITISWTGGGTLQSAPSLPGTWTDLTGKTSPATVAATGATGFYRIKQ